MTMLIHAKIFILTCEVEYKGAYLWPYKPRWINAIQFCSIYITFCNQSKKINK